MTKKAGMTKKGGHDEEIVILNEVKDL